MTGALPRPRPCASCPYRKDVPSGVWHPEEYERLKRYDGDMMEQTPNTFGCHQADGHACSGWLGHRDPADMLAVRIGITNGSLDVSCAEYETDVPLFESGAAAAEHGKRDYENPSPEAVAFIEKIRTSRSIRGVPVEG